LEPDQILEAMLRLARDPGAREELAKKAVERAGAFSWNHAAQATLEIYRELGG
jgi:glycosyltransferase involved in cell wall biosynthesis